MYSPELVGINNRQVMERELLKIQEVFDQYARLMVQFSNEIADIDSSNPEGAARTTRDLLLINPQRSGFTTQEDANKEFARRIDALEANGGDDIDLSDFIKATEKNYIKEGVFQLVWDDSADPNYPFSGRIGYNKNSADPNSLDGSFLYVNGVKGTFNIGRDGDVELHGASEIVGIEDRLTGERPWIKGFSYVQAKDFLDADGNSIIGAGGGGDPDWSQVDSSSVALGYLTRASLNAVAVGHQANSSYNSVAIGFDSNTDENCVCIGYQASTPFENATAIGCNARAGMSSIALGYEAEAQPYEFAISPEIGDVLFPNARVKAARYLDAEGRVATVSPSTMVDAFTTLQTAIADETTIEGIKTALTNSLGGLIEKFEGLKNDNL